MFVKKNNINKYPNFFKPIRVQKRTFIDVINSFTELFNSGTDFSDLTIFFYENYNFETSSLYISNLSHPYLDAYGDFDFIRYEKYILNKHEEYLEVEDLYRRRKAILPENNEVLKATEYLYREKKRNDVILMEHLKLKKIEYLNQQGLIPENEFERQKFLEENDLVVRSESELIKILEEIVYSKTPPLAKKEYPPFERK